MPWSAPRNKFARTPTGVSARRAGKQVQNELHIRPGLARCEYGAAQFGLALAPMAVIAGALPYDPAPDGCPALEAGLPFPFVDE
jgi:hypothetical protein